MEPPIVKAYVELMRPVQWMKNFFIFLPLFFGGRLFDGAVWVQGLLCFAAFSPGGEQCLLPQRHP